MRELLRRQHPKREAGVDKLRREALSRARSALDDLAEPDLLRECHTGTDALEGATIEEIRSVHRVSRPAQVIGERMEPCRLTQCVVEQHHFSHVAPWYARGRRMVSRDILAVVAQAWKIKPPRQNAGRQR